MFERNHCSRTRALLRSQLCAIQLVSIAGAFASTACSSSNAKLDAGGVSGQGSNLPSGTGGNSSPSDASVGRGGQAGVGGTQAGAGQGANSGSGGRSTGGNGMVGNAGQGSGGTPAMANDSGTRDGGGSDAGMSGGAPYLYVSGYGGDITRFKLDEITFAATKLGTTSGGTSPSYLAISPNKHYLYAINEADGSSSKVVAFTLDASDGHLTKINDAVTGGSGAPHLAVHPSGKWIAVAHYTSGQISILPVLDNGGVGAATHVEKGPNDGCGKAHQAVFDSTGNYLFVPCLDSNYVIQFKFSAGTLTYNTPSTAAVMGGPRHMALDPSEQYAFVISETGSLLTSFKYDASTGLLSDAQAINSYDQTAGASAHVVVHPSGHWLYASNRTENSIGLFSIDSGGRPHPVAFTKDMISSPRDFSVDPSGGFLISANEEGAQNVLIFKIAQGDGMLTRTQVVAVGGQPTFTKVLLLP